MASVNLKRGAVRAIEALLQDGNGDPIDLSGGSVRFQMRSKAATVLKVDGAAVVVDEETAQVRYTPTPTDTDTVGTYLAEWRITYAGGDVLVPEYGWLSVKIWEDLAADDA